MQIVVTGEISNLTYHSSGHIYFSIKDKESSLKAVMFRGNASRLKFKLEIGQSIECHGSVTAYIPRGDYQILCNKISLCGDGELSVIYEQLKKRLSEKGYFDTKYKKEIPKFISSIAIITSKTGAAIGDMLNIINKRWPMIKVYFINTLVQGDCKDSITSSIKKADSLCVDVIIVGRGGGSKEDLWGFNEEIVADTIYSAKTPIVSAVGHEMDYLISDFVADLRAPTPSAAIELILPDSSEYMQMIDDLQNRLKSVVENMLLKKGEQLNVAKKSLYQNSILSSINRGIEKQKELKNHLHKIIKNILYEKSKLIPLQQKLLENKIGYILVSKKQNLELLETSFSANEPTKNLTKYFAKISKDNRAVLLSDVKIGDNIAIEDKQHKVEASVLKISPI
jgi:exodeoxyribonuclease VII large subunit